MSQPLNPLNCAQSNPTGISHQSDAGNKSFSALFKAQSVSASPDFNITVKHPSSFRGKPAVFFSADDIQKLAAPLRFALIGKFSHGKPPIKDIRAIIDSIGIKGSHSTGVIDHKHILIRFTHEEDFQKFWCKEQWIIKKHPMRVFKWSTDFSPAHESPLVPIWISLPGLPLHLYSKSALFSIGCNIGTPMKLDQATYSLIRPSLARMCIEIDVSSDLPSSIWIGSAEVNEEGFWQEIIYEKVPQYCTTCFKLGHSKNICFSTNPQAVPKKLPTSAKLKAPNSAPSYVPKPVYVVKDGAGNEDGKADSQIVQQLQEATVHEIGDSNAKQLGSKKINNPVSDPGRDIVVNKVSLPFENASIIQSSLNADKDKIDQVIVDLVNSDVQSIAQHVESPISDEKDGLENAADSDANYEQQFMAGEWDNFIEGEKTSDIFKAIPSLIDKRRLHSRNYLTAMDLHVRSCKVNSFLSLDELKMTLRRDSASIASAILSKFPIADEAFTPVTRRRKKKKQSPGRTSVVTRAAAKTVFSFPPKP